MEIQTAFLDGLMDLYLIGDSALFQMERSSWEYVKNSVPWSSIPWAHWIKANLIVYSDVQQNLYHKSYTLIDCQHCIYHPSFL